MKRAVVRRMAAWAPGLASDAAWRAFALAPRALPAAPGAPEVRFLPPLVRRRCDDLTRALLHVANECASAEELARCATVFASRHASLGALVELLEALAAERPLSPNVFSHSVHNAPAGVFSVWAKNRSACSSIAAGPETFACGLLEALCLLARDPEREVLLVCGDEYPLAPLTQHAQPLAPTHAVAVRLAAGGEGPPLEVALAAAAGGAPQAGAPLPDALAFARWWHSDEAEIALLHAERCWTLRR